MRLLHTSDWHLGKTLEGHGRYAEQIEFVNEICDICDREKVDVVLIAGDIYQHANPSASAEELFYKAISRLSNNGSRAVVIIAGNHDNPERLCASTPLADEMGISLLGLPKNALAPYEPALPKRVKRIKAGASWVELAVPDCDHNVVIAALPYPSEGRLRELLSLSTQDNELRKGYNERLKQIFQELSTNFREDTVNVVLSHLYVCGGENTDSESPIQIGGAYAVDRAIFPEKAQYVALGHLHRPQNIKSEQVPIRYAGSPLAYSFSEAGQAKSVTIVDLMPGQKAQLFEIPLSSGKPLVKWVVRGGIEELEKRVASGEDSQAWIDLQLYLKRQPTIDEIQNIKSLHSGFVNVGVKVGLEAEKEIVAEKLGQLSLEQRFIRFYQRQTGEEEPEEELIKLFLELVQHNEEEYSEARDREEVSA
ncbi:exonuclease SbcCD subunit D [Heliorestis acidaminivorans]|uniref:Nuclease SbcCD subunit D n=1 Tax=Heliorestis acidaminivorans TaxID=553427 RepID=A0A6I0F2S2_9FIRM|nr:exonuclease SbcCD subunit D C-terminal domain-containing protein [Heliorestis acidaminivorans]KAB2954281.1 exonuclease SbcCD subunit D [Heliorestis acidaminivorans]